MKKWMLAALLVLALLVMSGCQSATQALARIGDEIEASRRFVLLKTPILIKREGRTESTTVLTRFDSVRSLKRDVGARFSGRILFFDVDPKGRRSVAQREPELLAERRKAVD